MTKLEQLEYLKQLFNDVQSGKIEFSEFAKKIIDLLQII